MAIYVSGPTNFVCRRLVQIQKLFGWQKLDLLWVLKVFSESGSPHCELSSLVYNSGLQVTRCKKLHPNDPKNGKANSCTACIRDHNTIFTLLMYITR